MRHMAPHGHQHSPASPDVHPEKTEIVSKKKSKSAPPQPKQRYRDSHGQENGNSRRSNANKTQQGTHMQRLGWRTRTCGIQPTHHGCVYWLHHKDESSHLGTITRILLCPTRHNWGHLRQHTWRARQGILQATGGKNDRIQRSHHPWLLQASQCEMVQDGHHSKWWKNTTSHGT